MPVELAIATNLPVSLVIGILTLDMPIVIGNAGCIAKRQHGHSWWHVAIHSNGDGKFSAGISVLLEEATPEELIWLAHSVGPDGKTKTIDAASEALKAVFKEKLCFLDRYDISTNHLPYQRNGVQVYSATAVDPEVSKQYAVLELGLKWIYLIATANPFSFSPFFHHNAFLKSNRMGRTQVQLFAVILPWPRF